MLMWMDQPAGPLPAMTLSLWVPEKLTITVHALITPTSSRNFYIDLPYSYFEDWLFTYLNDPEAWLKSQGWSFDPSRGNKKEVSKEKPKRESISISLDDLDL
jgi:hypothetical protein